MIVKVRFILFILFSISILTLYSKLLQKRIKNDGQNQNILKKQGETTRSLTIPLQPCSCDRTINTTWTKNDFAEGLFPKSNCGYWSTIRGMGQKVVSYSLYGKFHGDYHKGLENLIPLVKKLYPGWIMRVYHNGNLWDSEEEKHWACSLICSTSHLDFCNTSDIPELGSVNSTWGSLWRFIVVGDSTVERYIVRDLDSPILQREVDAVNEWINSGKCYHVMRDNPSHGVPMMAGMWGGCNFWQMSSSTVPRELRRQMLRYGTTVNTDQPALWEYIWPQVQDNGIMHDSFTCMKFPGSRPFPTKREGNTFVGMRTYKKGYEYDGIRRTCPEICRPHNHMDWQDC